MRKNVPDLFKSEWFKTRPDFIKDMIRKNPLGKYVMLETGADYYVPYSYCEDGTITAIRFCNLTEMPMWKVFGINPNDLIAIPKESE